MPIVAEQPYNIRAHRFARSPFYDTYAPAGTLVAVYNRRIYPWNVGDDVVGHYWHLSHADETYNGSFTPIVIICFNAEL